MNELNTGMPAAHAGHDVTYFVNGEEEVSSTPQLTVKQILEHAGFTPVADYTLASENPPDDFGSNYDEVIKLHPNERFQAKFKGPTPTS